MDHEKGATHRCQCYMGYELHDQSCQDIDECKNSEHDVLACNGNKLGLLGRYIVLPTLEQTGLWSIRRALIRLVKHFIKSVRQIPGALTKKVLTSATVTLVTSV